MPQTIEIRDVPEDLLRILEARAAREGKCLSDYLLAQLRRMTGVTFPDDKPTLAEWLERLKTREPVTSGFSTADAIRELRGPLPPE